MTKFRSHSCLPLHLTKGSWQTNSKSEMFSQTHLHPPVEFLPGTQLLMSCQDPWMVTLPPLGLFFQEAQSAKHVLMGHTQGSEQVN